MIKMLDAFNYAVTLALGAASLNAAVMALNAHMWGTAAIAFAGIPLSFALYLMFNRFIKMKEKENANRSPESAALKDKPGQ